MGGIATFSILEVILISLALTTPFAFISAYILYIFYVE